VITLLKLSPYTGDIVAPSPNHDARKAPGIEGIVLHATQDAGDEAVALSWLRSPRSHVSCHLLVGRDGHVTRLVGDRERAWHAGLSRWHGTTDVNSITLGIEIANRNDGERYSDAQYRKVADIVAHYCGQGLTLDDVVSHAEIAEGRKTDPVGWDWDRFRTLVLLRTQPVEEAPVIVATTPPPAASVQSLPNAPARAIVAPPAQSVPVVPKHVLRSRTFWLNLVTAVAGGGILLNDALDVIHKVGIHLPDQVTKWALFLVGIMNIILRWRTSRPITCSDGVHCSSPRMPKGFPDRPLFLREVRQKVDARGAAAYAARSSRKAYPVG
jgi:hypothetical protein